MLLVWSITVTRQKRLVCGGGAWLDGGVKLVWPEPSGTVPVRTIVLNAALVEISNLYTRAPTGPDRTALTTVKVGHRAVVPPLAGLTGTGASMTIAAPMLNLKLGPKVPAVAA